MTASVWSASRVVVKVQEVRLYDPVLVKTNEQAQTRRLAKYTYI